MIATAMLLDFPMTCPHCEHITWASDTHSLSRTEHEWECPGCQRFVYQDLS